MAYKVFFQTPIRMQIQSLCVWTHWCAGIWGHYTYGHLRITELCDCCICYQWNVMRTLGSMAIHKHDKFVLEEIKIYEEVQMFLWESMDQKKIGIRK